MRELTKSMLSFSWAMPLYGMKQMLNITLPRDMSRPWGEATDGLNSVTGAMREQLGSTMKGMFDAGDQIQRGLVDAMYSLGFGAFDPNTWMRMGSGSGGQGQGSGGSGSGATQSGNRAADYGARAAEYGARSMEQGARAATEAVSATAAAFGYNPSSSGQSTSGGGRSNRSR